MKTFRHKLGHVACQTMTVSELKEKLSEYPDGMPVFCTWEGVMAYVQSNNFDVSPVHHGDLTEECDCLVIDVESY